MPHIRAHVVDVGMACCAVEFVAAVARGLLVPEPTDRQPAVRESSDDFAIDTATSADSGSGLDGQPVFDVLIVSGTVTHALVPAVVEAWQSLPEPRAAIAFGACTISGGPYWDSYAVAPGIDEVIPVARYVPGCPPRPEAVIEALVALAEPSATGRRDG